MCVCVESLKEALSSDGGVTPAVEQLLLSCDLYSRAFTSQPLSSIITAPPGDHSTLLQVLDRHSCIPLDRQNPVSDTQLKHKPINMVSRRLYQFVTVTWKSRKFYWCHSYYRVFLQCSLQHAGSFDLDLYLWFCWLTVTSLFSDWS